MLLQLPGLRDTSVRIGLRFWHPDLRRVGLEALSTHMVGLCKQEGFDLTAERAGQIGVEALRVRTERDLDVWRW